MFDAAEAAERLRGGGRIVNFSSSVVGLLMPTYGIYVATKAAVEGLTSDIADVVSFLAGPDAAWVNGQVLRVNGGII
jgi:3-oxoacyl-[acyl-carrier protein] reductase